MSDQNQFTSDTMSWHFFQLRNFGLWKSDRYNINNSQTLYQSSQTFVCVTLTVKYWSVSAQ